MKRTLYYNGVELLAEHLNYTEETKIEAIRKIVTSFGICGVLRGLYIQPEVAPNQTKVRVTSGFGYTYGGDFYEVRTDIRNIGINNSKGVLNYIVVKINYIEEYPAQDVVSGQVRYTRQSEQVELLVLSQQEWNNISDKSNYSLLGIVRGSDGAVSNDDIYNTNTGDIKFLFVANQPLAINGVKVKAVGKNTATGNGILKYEYINGMKQISWKSPNIGSNFGNPVVIGADGTYRLWDSLGVSYIDINITTAKLLTESISESITIIDLFEQTDFAMGTMNDRLHRSMLGSGTVSPSNPHGQTLDDFDPGINQDLIRHRRVEHSPGIIGNAGSLSLQPSIDMINRSYLIIEALDLNEAVVSNGRVIQNFGRTTINLESYKNKLVYVYLTEDGGLGISETINDLQNYFVIAGVSVDTNGYITNVIDKRVWGSISDLKVYYSGGDLLNPLQYNEYTINDSINMIKYILKELMGTNNWNILPSKSIVEILTIAETAKSMIMNHVNDSYRDGLWIHGVKLGHGGYIDSDMLDGIHKNTGHTTDSSGINSDMLDGIHKNTGHTQDNSGINSDMLDGKHWSDIYIDIVNRLKIIRQLERVRKLATHNDSELGNFRTTLINQYSWEYINIAFDCENTYKAWLKKTVGSTPHNSYQLLGKAPIKLSKYTKRFILAFYFTIAENAGYDMKVIVQLSWQESGGYNQNVFASKEFYWGSSSGTRCGYVYTSCVGDNHLWGIPYLFTFDYSFNMLTDDTFLWVKLYYYRTSGGHCCFYFVDNIDSLNPYLSVIQDAGIADDEIIVVM